MQKVDDCAFVVRLKGSHVHVQVLAPLDDCVGELGQGRGAVDVWFARAQEVEVGAVDEQDLPDGRGRGRDRCGQWVGHFEVLPLPFSAVEMAGQ